MVNALMVNSDRSTWTQALDVAIPVFRRPILRGCRWDVPPDEDAQPVTYAVEEFTCEARLPDGRAIYCAPGIGVVEALATYMVSDYERAYADDMRARARREADQLLGVPCIAESVRSSRYERLNATVYALSLFGARKKKDAAN